jgi:hypothetical protein
MINKMVHIAEEFGRPIATPEETRQILKLGTWYDSPKETLFNLGLPPVCEEGERGFLTYETDEGRLHAPAGNARRSQNRPLNLTHRLLRPPLDDHAARRRRYQALARLRWRTRLHLLHLVV